MMPSISIGSITISSYKLMICVGALGMLVYILYRKNQFQLKNMQCVAFAILLTVCGIAGARLLYILENLHNWQTALTNSGVSFFGSVFLIPLIMPLIGKLFRLKNVQTLDLCAPCVAIMIGCIRVGCFLTGCCGGRLAYIGGTYITWPTQAMESIGDFAIFLTLHCMPATQENRGQLYPRFMLSYSILRFFVEFLRDTPRGWLNLAHGHWFALVSIFTAVLWIQLSQSRKKRL